MSPKLSVNGDVAYSCMLTIFDLYADIDPQGMYVLYLYLYYGFAYVPHIARALPMGFSSFPFPRARTGLKPFPVAARGILSYAKLRASGRFMELA